jgi:putative lipoic acid-binding regulatory protein
MGNTVVKNKTTGENINISNAKKASIKVGNEITNKNGKKYTIVECNKKSYTNSFKNMGKGIGESMGKMGTSMKESTVKLAQSAKESVGTSMTLGKTTKSANVKKNSIKITKTDIENVENLFKSNNKLDIILKFSKDIISTLNNPGAKSYLLSDIISRINTDRKSMDINKKFVEIYRQYNTVDSILKKKPNVQRIGNKPTNNKTKNKILNYIL